MRRLSLRKAQFSTEACQKITDTRARQGSNQRGLKPEKVRLVPALTVCRITISKQFQKRQIYNQGKDKVLLGQNRTSLIFQISQRQLQKSKTKATKNQHKGFLSKISAGDFFYLQFCGNRKFHLRCEKSTQICAKEVKKMAAKKLNIWATSREAKDVRNDRKSND